jgi:hypothetical protein
LAHARGISSIGAISANASALFSTPSHPAYVSASCHRYTLKTIDCFFSGPIGSRLWVSNSTFECGNGNARISCSMFMCAFGVGAAAATGSGPRHPRQEQRQAQREQSHHRHISRPGLSNCRASLSAPKSGVCRRNRPSTAD